MGDRVFGEWLGDRIDKSIACIVNSGRDLKITMSFVFADLFAGIGGFRLALESIGGECAFSSEWDKYAQMTYKDNFGGIPHGDITQIKPSSIPDIDILTAGFPCQPFSSIGKREGFEHPTQGTLFYDVVKILTYGSLIFREGDQIVREDVYKSR